MSHPRPKYQGFIKNHELDLCLDWEVDEKYKHGDFHGIKNVVSRRCHDKSAMWELDCNQDCVYDDWSDWGECDQLCGGGKKVCLAMPARGM